MQLESNEKACWFIAADTIYLAGPFYTHTQAKHYLNKCTDKSGYTTIRIEGETFALNREDVGIVRDIYWL